MAKLKIGEYIRDDSGEFGKIVKVDEFNDLALIEFKEGVIWKIIISKSDYLFKHNSNPLELIEEGDFIKYDKYKNYIRVKNIFYGEGIYKNRPILYLENSDLVYKKYDIKKIKSIVTREKIEEESYLF